MNLVAALLMLAAAGPGIQAQELERVKLNHAGVEVERPRTLGAAGNRRAAP